MVQMSTMRTRVHVLLAFWGAFKLFDTVYQDDCLTGRLTHSHSSLTPVSRSTASTRRKKSASARAYSASCSAIASVARRASSSVRLDAG